mgnify:FL=1
MADLLSKFFTMLTSITILIDARFRLGFFYLITISFSVLFSTCGFFFLL